MKTELGLNVKNRTRALHYEGNVDVENVTTASGVLGLKGRHPEAEDKENENPNQRKRPKKSQGDIQSSLTMDTDEETFENVEFTPCSMTPQSSVISSSRYPARIGHHK
jgi:hypothetical protein